MQALWRRTVAITLLFIPLAARAAEMTSEQLYEKFKPAVVKINILQQGLSVGMGSGFFVDAQGGLITNSHVAELALAGQFTAQFTTSDGTVVKSFEIARCSDVRGIDLCYMRIPYKPKTWFEPKKMDFKVGQQLFTIGHPKGFEFTISQGLLSGVRRMAARGFRPLDGPESVETIQINAPISPGNSGGPAFNAKGELIGVVTWTRIDVDAKELSFTISANEVVDYIANSPTFISRQAHRERQKEASNKLEATLKKKIVDPAWDVLVANEKARSQIKQLDPTHWSRLEIKSDEGVYETYVPRSMSKNCSDYVTAKKMRFTECSDENGGILQFTFASSPNAMEELRALEKKTPTPVPFPIVKSMMASGEWESISKSLSDKQRKFLFSVPAKAKCREYKSSLVRPGTPFVRCTQLIFNDESPSASSSSVFLAQEGSSKIVRILAWTPGQLEGVYFSYAGIAGELFKFPTTSNSTAPAQVSAENTDSLKKLLSFLRTAMIATKSEFGSYPRDLNKVLSEQAIASLQLPPDFHYRVFVMPACARQSKPTDKTEVTNITAAAMKAQSGAKKSSMEKVTRASESMSDKLVDQRCPSPRENFSIIGVGHENDTLTIALVDRRKVDILTKNGVKQ